MKVIWGILFVLSGGLMGTMFMGMITVPWLDFTEFTIAPALGVDSHLAWVGASIALVLGLLLLTIFFGSRLEGVKFREML